jgi:hypothetical protein
VLRPARRAVSAVLGHPIEVAIVLVASAQLAYTVRVTGASWFWSDEPRLLRQASDLSGFFEPYNTHLSVTILGFYRISGELFGLSYLPVRIGAMTILALLPLLYFAHARRPLGPFAAALLALPLVWAPHLSVYPGQLNHYLVLAGAIGAAAALDRGPRADWILAASLAFALLSAGGGAAVAAACTAHLVLVRPGWRRWVMVLVPTALWTLWWLREGQGSGFDPVGDTSLEAGVRYAWDLAFSAFEAAALGSSLGGAVLMAAFLLYGGWLVRQGLSAAASFIAWTGGLVAWAVGLKVSRGGLADLDTYRYLVPALGFLLLAVVPRKRALAPLPRRLVPAGRTALLGAAAVVLALGIAKALVVRDDVQASARQMGVIGRFTHGTALVLDLEPSVVPPSKGLGFNMGVLTAGQYRDLFEQYGRPGDESTATVDEELVDRQIVRTFNRNRPPGDCAVLDGTIRLGSGRVTLWSDLPTWTVDVRRFGEDWVRVRNVSSGRALIVTLPALGATIDYLVRAPGACVLEYEPTS